MHQNCLDQEVASVLHLLLQIKVHTVETATEQHITNAQDPS